MKTEKAPPPKCKVTMQYRSLKGFVYELDNSGVALELHVSREPPWGNTGDWHMAAHQGRKSAAIVSESAATRAEALNLVERSWVAKATEIDLPVLDWAAVATALLSVRAI